MDHLGFQDSQLPKTSPTELMGRVLPPLLQVSNTILILPTNCLMILLTELDLFLLLIMSFQEHLVALGLKPHAFSHFVESM